MRSKDWTLLLGVLLSCKTKLEGPFEVREGASDLLFTWIDARGDYHVDQAERDVPIASRQVVRVVDPKRDDGSHDDKVYLVDLTARSPSGLYPVHSAPLKEFEAIANARRSKQSSVPQQLPPVATGPSMAPVKDEGAGASAPVVIIYGASWCGPCHDAERFLKLRGIPYVMKDVERDANAASAMQAKLSAAGRRNGSIPVIDVGGKILVGYSEASLADALGKSM
jgi:glutaredoxin